MAIMSAAIAFTGSPVRAGLGDIIYHGRDLGLSVVQALDEIQRIGMSHNTCNRTCAFRKELERLPPLAMVNVGVTVPNGQIAQLRGRWAYLGHRNIQLAADRFNDFWKD
jgi:hypothetical protein